MKLIDAAEIRSIKERIRNLTLRDDLSTTAVRVLFILNRKADLTNDDLWFLELIEERYGIAPADK